MSALEVYFVREVAIRYRRKRVKASGAIRGCPRT